MNNTRYLELDFYRTSYKSVKAHQYDKNTRFIEVTCINDASVCQLNSDSMNCRLKLTTPDGRHMWKDEEIQANGTILISLEESMLLVPGICKAELNIYELDSQKLLSTMPFDLIVIGSVYDNSIIESTDEFNALNTLLFAAHGIYETLKEHITNFLNPHKVTKTQVGLGNVPNVTTNNQTPSYTEADSLTKLVSGEKLSVAFGKISKSITDLISHIANKNNPHGITKGQVGLGHADDTSDQDKPVSIAQQTALDKKVDKTTVADPSTLGLVKSGTDITVDANGNVSVNDNSHKHTVNNISDLTATAAELNVMHGITASTAELNYTDGVTSNIQTQLNSKAPTANPILTGIPKAPTAAAGADTTQIATTAFTQTAVSNHNASPTAHNDIRDLIAGLTTRLNALADSDDTTLDQLSEIVSYIKSNRTLIENVTTNKINVSDIVNNLTSTSANKPLSAKQGKVLKDLIDALTPASIGALPASTKYAESPSVGGDANRAVKLKDSNNGKDITVTYGKTEQSSTSCLASWNGYELGAISPSKVNAGSAASVLDYGDASKTIKIGFTGTGLSADQATHIAAYTDSGRKIKDLSFANLKVKMGLDKVTNTATGNGTVTINQAGVPKGTFTMNQNGNTTIELTDNNTTYSAATQSAPGLMSAGDKKNLMVLQRTQMPTACQRRHLIPGEA